MEGNVCKVCKFISIDGTIPEKCPVCGSPKSAFEEKADAIKTAADPAGLTDFEKKHIPVIKVMQSCGLVDGCHDVNVKVGEIKHPMLVEHFITFIDFYLNRSFLARVHLTPVKLNSAAGIHFSAESSGKVSVISNCNQHGAWIGDAQL